MGCTLCLELYYKVVLLMKVCVQAIWENVATKVKLCVSCASFHARYAPKNRVPWNWSAMQQTVDNTEKTSVSVATSIGTGSSQTTGIQQAELPENICDSLQETIPSRSLQMIVQELAEETNHDTLSTMDVMASE